MTEELTRRFLPNQTITILVMHPLVGCLQSLPVNGIILSPMDISLLRQKFKEGKVIIRDHALMRFDQRGISIEEIEQIIMNGEIIENYPDDKPYPSCLILGHVQKDVPLYAVCALGERVHIITAHWLDPNKWLDSKTRRDK